MQKEGKSKHNALKENPARNIPSEVFMLSHNGLCPVFKVQVQD